MEKKQKSIVVMVRLAPVLHDELVKLAEKNFTTKSDMLRRCLVSYILEQKDGEK